MMANEVIGVLVIGEDCVRRETYECAAWFTDHILTPGEYPVTVQFLGSVPHHAVARVPSVVQKDYFQALYCGMPVGKPYDYLQNAGKPSTWRFWSYRYLLTGGESVPLGKGMTFIPKVSTDAEGVMK